MYNLECSVRVRSIMGDVIYGVGRSRLLGSCVEGVGYSFVGGMV